MEFLKKKMVRQENLHALQTAFGNNAGYFFADCLNNVYMSLSTRVPPYQAICHLSCKGTRAFEVFFVRNDKKKVCNVGGGTEVLFCTWLHYVRANYIV